MEPYHCVAFLLIQNGCVLAEKRTLTTRLDPGAIAIPGGHVEAGETRDQALHREAKEELNITLSQVRFVCSLLQASPEPYWIHYFASDSWTGQIGCRAADALLWIPLNEPEKFDVAVDRQAIAAYQRLPSVLSAKPSP